MCGSELKTLPEGVQRVSLALQEYTLSNGFMQMLN
jgi:hypothetical protein